MIFANYPCSLVFLLVLFRVGVCYLFVKVMMCLVDVLLCCVLVLCSLLSHQLFVFALLLLVLVLCCWCVCGMRVLVWYASFVCLSWLYCILLWRFGFGGM